MCIRDSVTSEAMQDFGPHAEIRGPPCTLDAGSEGHHPRRERRGCLLYTSDAADERSSVDLGGRRIIKKKKTDKDGLSRIRRLTDSSNTQIYQRPEGRERQ